MGNLRFTYEEFLTILNQIEGVLNSRPLYPLSCDPGDFDALTPGHFLVGRPVTAIVEPSLTEVSDNSEYYRHAVQLHEVFRAGLPNFVPCSSDEDDTRPGNPASWLPLHTNGRISGLLTD
ncbi:integrase catalytic domain-containing protein [Trichonephila clavipes]|nr:integrase catalytic domain-containing protein [Trichonephila clavipes]